MSDQIRILVVDDETSILDSLRILFKGEGFDVATAQGGQQGVEAIEATRPDIVLTDIRMPGSSGIDVLQRAKEVDPSLPVILMTAQASLQSAMRAVNEGAYYYLQKPFANDELIALCRRAAEARHLRVENKALKQEIKRRNGTAPDRPIGRSKEFLEVLKLAETVAPQESTILIGGESGTGKEVLARFIHANSARSGNPFFSINCGALTESLLESELFGHVKGAFTGAVKDKEGLLVAAAGGTLFLDEVGELSPATQVKLLRALQEREVIPVGATEPVNIHVRILAATNRELEDEIRKGTFRSDLYYRLNVIQLRLPPLRERQGDIPLLAEYFAQQIVQRTDIEGPLRIADDAMERLLEYDWPGNVRELENALERAAVLSKNGQITKAGLPERVREARPVRLIDEGTPPNPTMEVVERAYILWVLQAEGGNKTRAAEVLGIDPSTLYRKLNRYGVDG